MHPTLVDDFAAVMQQWTWPRNTMHHMDFNDTILI